MARSGENDLVQKAFDTFCIPSNSEAKALELLSQLPNPATVRNKYEHNNTLLHYACLNGWYNVAKTLVKNYNSDPKCKNNAGCTPLHSASKVGNLDIIKYFIEIHHCDPESKSDSRNTPLFLASQKGRLNVIRYLVEERNCNPAHVNKESSTPLHAVCKEGHFHAVKYLIEEKQCDPDCQDNDGTTPLQLACQYGHLHITKYLVEEKHSNLLHRNNSGCAALDSACLGGHLDIVRYLVEERQCDLASENSDGWTPLHMTSDIGIVKYLVEEKHCDPACRDNVGHTPLHAASELGELNLVKYFVGQQHCDPHIVDNNGDTPLHHACTKGYLEVVEYLVEERDDLVTIMNKEGKTPLHTACQYRYLEVVRYLIEEKQCDPDCQDNDGTTPLQLACQYGHLHITKYLVEEKHSNLLHRNNSGCAALDSACLGGHLDIVRYLVEERQCDLASENSDGWTPLHMTSDVGIVKYLVEEKHCDPACRDNIGYTLLHSASELGELDLVKYLVGQQHCDPHIVENNGDTPLHCACSNGYLEVVEYLVEERDDLVTIMNKKGKTPLHTACQYGYLEVVRYLIEEKQCDPDCQDNDGTTPLHVASRYRHLHLTKYLIEEKHCDPNCKGRNDMTPLHSACIYGNLDVVQYLVENQYCDLDPLDKNGVTPLQLAYNNKHRAVAEFLENHLSLSLTNEEQKYLDAIKLAIEEKGELHHSILHGVFVGPARSGKDSLMKRLLNERPSHTTESTGVAERVFQVKVEKLAASVGETKWTRIKHFDQQAIEMMKDLTTRSSILPSLHQNENTNRGSSEVVECSTGSNEVSDRENKGAGYVFVSNDIFDQQLPVSKKVERSAQKQKTKIKNSIPSVNKSKSPLDIFKEAICRRGMEGLQQQLKTCSLYLTNTGGQMEFQELFPLVVAGPSIFFITFPLHKDLKKRYKIKYELGSEGKQYEYESSLSPMEMILQTFASIHAAGTFDYHGLQKERVPLRSKIFIIGTHKDLLEQNSQPVTEQINAIDQAVKEAVCSTSLYHKHVEHASNNQLIFTVNNFDQSDHDFQLIRSAVDRVIQRNHFKIHAPSNWLIYSLILSNSMKRASSYADCVKLAQECGISGNDVDQALHFIQLTMGLIRYFPHDSDLKNIVITDPLVLFEKVTNLLVKTFTFERVGKPSSDDFKKGIFSHDEFEQYTFNHSSDPISCSQFLKMLKLLRIVSPFQDDAQGIVKYFVPCAITHITEKADHPHYESLAAPPLLISFFDCGFVPKGFSGALIVFLMTNEVNSFLRWELQPQFIFRDHVTFFITPSCDSVTLRILSTHLEIIFLSDPSRGRNDDDDFPLESTCFELCKSIKAGIDAITSSLAYINTKPSLTYYCHATGCCGQHPARPICLDGSFAPRRLICPRAISNRSNLPEKHKIWGLQKLTSTVNDQTANAKSKTITPASETQPSIPLTVHTAFRQLLSLASKWQNIGTLLELDTGALNTIEYNERGKAIDCLRKMLSMWMKQTDPPPSWLSLANAVEPFDPSKAQQIQSICGINTGSPLRTDSSIPSGSSTANVGCLTSTGNDSDTKLKQKLCMRSIFSNQAKVVITKCKLPNKARRGTKRQHTDDKTDELQDSGCKRLKFY